MKAPRIINASQEGRRLMLWYADGTKHEFKPVGSSYVNRELKVIKAVAAIRAK